MFPCVQLGGGGLEAGKKPPASAQQERQDREEKKKTLKCQRASTLLIVMKLTVESASIVSTVNPALVSADKELLGEGNIVH